MDSTKIIKYDGGFYITISFLKDDKYDAQLMKKAYQKLKEVGAIDIDKAHFHNVEANDVTYKKIFNSEDGFEVSGGAIEKYLGKNVLAHLDLAFPFNKETHWMRMQPFINKDDSFSVSLDMSHWNLFESKEKEVEVMRTNMGKIQDIAFEINELDEFVWGMIGVEQEVYSISELIEGTWYLPMDLAFYGNRLLNVLGREDVISLLSNCKEIKEFENGSIYFRWTDIDNPKGFHKDFLRFKEYIHDFPTEKFKALLRES